MKARVLDPQIPLYAQPDPASPVIAQLTDGQEIEIRGIVSRNGQNWKVVTLPDGRQGYLISGAALFPFRDVWLVADADVRVEPSPASPVLARYPGGTALQIVGTISMAGRTWEKVRDGDGKEGFLPEGTSMAFPSGGPAPMPSPSPDDRVAAAARRNMLVGGLWCGGGIAVTAITYLNASGGGTYVVAWGAIIFGGFQFLKGLSQYQ